MKKNVVVGIADNANILTGVVVNISGTIVVATTATFFAALYYLNRLVYLIVVKTRSSFSLMCSKKMTTIVMINTIYSISLRFRISNIH
ncbi:hypothetical protein [Ferruginibacter sp.]|nr:hypothetical protein [Ferruginibacter sp.]